MDKPRIELIQDRARQRLDQFDDASARSGARDRGLSRAAIDYSYAREDFRRAA